MINDIADWIASVIQAVPGSNQVYPYLREVRGVSQLVQDFGSGQQDDEQVEITRGWMVKVKSKKPTLITYDGTASVLYLVQIEGLSSLHGKGESAREFNQQSENVVFALNQWVLPPDLPNVEILQVAQIESLSERIWPATGGRLHHHALITLTVRTKEKIKEG